MGSAWDNYEAAARSASKKDASDAEKIRKIRQILAEQPVNQYETGAESQSKLSRIERILR